MQPTGSAAGGDGPNSSTYNNSNNTGSSTSDDGEKGSKIRQQRRQAFGRKVLHILFATTVVVSTMSVFIVKYHHSPKIRGHVSRTNFDTDSTPTVKKNKNHKNQHHQKHHQKHHHTNTNHDVDVPNIDTLPVNSIYRLSMKDSNGIVQSLSQYIGMVTLVVNTACKWGKTDTSFTELAILQDKLGGGSGTTKFSVLAFPILDFHQEYSTDLEIQSFVTEQYPDMIHFPIFTVSTLSTNPIYIALQQQKPDVHVQHNFYKYLVGPDGMAVHLYPKSRDPLTLYTNIEQLMAAQ